MTVTCSLVSEPRAWPASDDADIRVTQLLQEWSDGDSDALDQLMSVVYESLRSLAAARLRRERSDHVLDATALVHEAYMRMKDLRCAHFRDRAHFLAMAGRLMRRILVDHARTHCAAKRGAGAATVSLDEALFVSTGYAEHVLDLNEALERLKGLDLRQATIVELRYFADLSLEEVAEVVGVSLSTVKSELRSGRAWLAQQLAS